ncbi:MAG TPA: hypothetical protein ENG27_00235 [Candidatus Bathyarchaeota archaeon]|nr:hypothetical protein [Candidatus Bathyarchaeota archaeon]
MRRGLKVDGKLGQGGDLGEILASLEIGDIVEVRWLDASEALQGLPKSDREYDTPVVSLGYFLGVKGSRTKHIVIAKEIVLDVEFHYNCIPLGMIEHIRLVSRGQVRKTTIRKMVSRLESTPLKRLKKGRRAGWLKL